MLRVWDIDDGFDQSRDPNIAVSGYQYITNGNNTISKLLFDDSITDSNEIVLIPYVAIRFASDSFHWEKGIISSSPRSFDDGGPTSTIDIIKGSTTTSVLSIVTIIRNRTSPPPSWVFRLLLTAGSGNSHAHFWWKVIRSNE